MVYLLDTNVIINYLHGNSHVQANFHNAVMNNCDIAIPKMVDYEIRRGFLIRPNPRREVAYNTFAGDCNIVDIDTNTWNYAMAVYAGHHHNRHTVGEIDILIASLCIQNNYVLVTNNAKDFQNVSGIKLVDWSQPK